MYRIGVVCAMGVFVCHMNDIWYVWCAKWIIETNTFEHVYTNSLHIMRFLQPIPHHLRPPPRPRPKRRPPSALPRKRYVDLSFGLPVHCHVIGADK